MSTLTITFLHPTDGDQTELASHHERILRRQGLVHVETDDEGAHYTIPAGSDHLDPADIDYNELASIAREEGYRLTIYRS